MKQDQKEIAYQQSYEVKDMCRKFKVSKKIFMAIVALLPHKHSMEQVEAALIGYGYAKHPRKRKDSQTGIGEHDSFSVE